MAEKPLSADAVGLDGEPVRAMTSTVRLRTDTVPVLLLRYG